MQSKVEKIFKERNVQLTYDKNVGLYLFKQNTLANFESFLPYLLYSHVKRIFESLHDLFIVKKISMYDAYLNQSKTRGLLFPSWPKPDFQLHTVASLCK